MPKKVAKKAAETVKKITPTASTKRQQILRFALQHWGKILVAVLCSVPVLGIAYFLLKPDTPEVITAVAERSTLVQTVEAVGTVISEKDLELKFPVTGVVDEVLITEGDIVSAGQVLATLRSGTITKADVNSAAANLQAAQADLQALVEGTRPEEILIAEAEVENRKASLRLAQKTLETSEASLQKSLQKLEILKQEADANLLGNINSADSAIQQRLSSIQSSLNVLDDIFSTSVVEHAVEFQNRIALEAFRSKQKDAKAAIVAMLFAPASTNYTDALLKLTTARSAALQGVTAIDAGYQVLVATELGNYFDRSTKETYKANITTQRTTAETALTALTDELESFRDVAANYQTLIAAEESAVTTMQGTTEKARADISTYQTLLRTQEAQLALKRAGARQTDIAGAKARVNQAYAELQRAQSRFDDTVLRAPIDGRITKADLKKGEFTGDLENFERAITMLGDSPYRVEIFTSEIDIPKVQLAQTGAIELDAYPERDFWLSVTEIDPAATSVDGVPKYRIKLDFVEDVENVLKIGMTGDVDIITDIRYDVVHVPGRAVIRNGADETVVRVQNKNLEIEERVVITGMETDTAIEIVEGIVEGETIVILLKD